MNRVRTALNPPARRLSELVALAEWDARPDAELLDRFARYAEQPAFEAILRRHGPLVLGVCRRQLSNPADAEDAFQATFLVLVRKARSVARGERLGPWLYGVAYRVARKVRERAARFPTCDPEAAAVLPDPAPPADPDDWLPILDRELSALPAKYREPLVLCELQGLTRKAAAERLREREGTLSSRLARGREMLRRRLLRHGTLLPAGGLVALLGGLAGGAVPAALLARAAELAAAVSGGERLAGIVPAGVARLADEVTKGMFLTKLRVTGVGGLAAVVAVVLALSAPAAPEQEPRAARAAAAPAPRPVDGPRDAPKAPVVAGDLATIQGAWDGELVVEGGAAVPPDVRGPWRCVVRGDVAFILRPGQPYAARYEVRLTADRDPKWIDLVTDGHSHTVAERVAGAVTPGVYRLTPGGWEVALPAGRGSLRPAEFHTDGEQVVAVRFRRLKEPAGARRELLGRWTVTRQAYPHQDRSAMVDRAVGVVEIAPEYMFIQRPCDGSGKQFVWEAAEYDLSPARNPKWIDLLFAPGTGPDAAGFGVYERTGDVLRISYRIGVPRSLRTLEFKAGIEEWPAGPTAAKGPKPACGLLELKRVPGGVPPAADPDPEVGAALPPRPAAVPAADPSSPARVLVDRAQELLTSGRYAEAEAVLGGLLRDYPAALEVGLARLMLGVSVLPQAASDADAGRARRRREEALALFEGLVKEPGDPATDLSRWVRRQAALRVLQANLQLGRPREVLDRAAPMLRESRGRVDELIVLSMVYHAQRGLNWSDEARRTRDRMAEVFAALRNDPTAFPATSGEFSRGYWEKVWFGPARQGGAGPDGG
jgi:RNA polymerase sigma factor (sigma-70 family)